MIRTIEDLTKLDGVVYVFLEDAATGQLFLENATKEGFTFGDGAVPTSREYASVMAIHEDKTLNYVGAVGNMAFGTADSVGGKHLYKVDYGAYVSNKENYMYNR